MSRIDDQQSPGPAGDAEEQMGEPRLLTRSVATDDKDHKDRLEKRRQHAPEGGLRAWAAHLSARRSGQGAARKGTGPARRSPGAAGRALVAVRWGLAVLLLVCVAISLWVLSLRHASTAALPVLDGEVPVSGLSSAVTVTRDGQGVPTIHAANVQDLLFAQGYVTAGDRLWQMDALRRHAAGELAEVLGPSMLEHDRRQRLLQIRATADRAAAHLPPDQKAMLEAYAHGVNRYIETHRGTLPVEFRLLGYKPAPWTPRDSLLVSLAMFQDLSTRFPQKLDREALGAHLPAALLPDLYPVGSWRDSTPAAQNRSITAPHPVELIPLDPSQAQVEPRVPGLFSKPQRLKPLARPEELLAVNDALASTDRCPDCRAGSNNWAVSGARTASGKPMVSNDMHLNLLIPDTWYEASLHAPDGGIRGAGADGAGAVSGLDVTGFTLPGIPLVIVGRNAHVAWGLTNLGADVQDVRTEHLRGEGAGAEYERPDGTWAAVGHHEERIRVRGGLDRTLDVLTTTHAVGESTMETPVISPLYPSDRRTLSLAWSAYADRALSLPLFAVNSATDGASLVQAYATFGGPTLNLVWADTDGHIGYHAIGLIPVRGPATPRPRETTAPVNLSPEGSPATGAGEGEGDQTPGGVGPAAFPVQMGVGGVHFLRSAWRPVRAGRARRVAPAVPRATGRRRGGVRRGGVRRGVAAVAPAEVEPAVVGPVARNYTVGSPLSGVPVDALDPAQAWSGYIAYTDLPAVTDPAGGVLATANSRITPDDYPWAVTNDWADPFRTERIVHLLSRRMGLQPADMLAVENDVHSDVDQAMGQRVAYALDHASGAGLGKDARRLHQAADLLRSWDGEVTVSSPAAAVLAAVREALPGALLRPQIAAHDGGNTLDARGAAEVVALYHWGERTTALELLLQHQPARWLPPVYGNWNDFLADVTERALVAAGAPADLSRWRYGRMHTVELAQPIFGQHPLLARLLGVRGTTGAQAAPGDATTVKAIGAHFGPSERFTADLSSADAALGNVTTGESENGRSPWYLDQFGPWLAGTTFALPGAGTAATHTLRLVPAEGGAS